VVRIQEKVLVLPEAGGFGSAYSYSQHPEYRTWAAAVLAILERAEQRMRQPWNPGSSYVKQATQILSRHQDDQPEIDLERFARLSSVFETLG
jgi:hypothetical protein